MTVILSVIYAVGILIPEDAVASSFLNAQKPPSMEHPFGTDALGRDLLLRTLKGMAVSMSVGLTASLVSAGIAVLAGIAAATGS